MGRNDTILSAADEVQHVSWFHWIFLNRWCWLGVTLFICAVVIPITVYLLCFNNFEESPETCSISEGYRVRCGPENTDEENCDILGCCYVTNVCYHPYPSRYHYELNKDGSYQTKRENTPFGNPTIKELGITKQILSDNRIDVIIYDRSRKEIKELSGKSQNLECTVYTNATITIDHPIRNGKNITREQILSTDNGPLIASNGYWEMTVTLQTKYIFGLGQQYLKDPNLYIFYNNPQSMNSIPIVLGYKNKIFYGLFVNNNGPLEIEMLASKMLILRSRTKMSVGFHLSVVIGNSFSQIMDMFRNNGKDPAMWIQMPYWNLGVHVCRELEGTATNVTKILAEAKEFFKNATDAGLPYETDCLDGNLFSFIMNTTSSENKQIETFIKQSKKDQNKKFIMTFSPQLAESKSAIYADAINSEILYRNPDTCNKVLTRSYRNRTVAYPNYGHQNAKNWFNKYINDIPAFHSIDGLILRDTWPLFENYTANLTTMDFIYLNEEFENAFTSVLPWNSQTNCKGNETNIHFETHNKYGFNLGKLFENYVKSQNLSQEKLIFTSSSYYNNLNELARIGTFNQNVTLTWLNLQKTLSQSLFYSTLVDPLLFTTPVCGSIGELHNDAAQQLCVRWYLTTATFPIFYMGNNTPFKFPSKYYQKKVIEILQRRYALLPYFYTVMNYNEIGRETKLWPLVRPVYYHFPFDNATYNLNSQYMIGSNLLVAQMLLPGMIEMLLYLPSKNQSDNYETVWYEFWNGQSYNLGTVSRKRNETMDNTGKVIKIFPSVTDWIMFILGGNIVAIQEFQDMAGNSIQLRLEPLVLIVALECKKETVSSENGENCRAEGLHIVTDTTTQPQEILRFESNEHSLRISNIKRASQWLCKKELRKSSSVIKKVIVYYQKNRFQIALNKDLCDEDIKTDNYDVHFNKKKIFT